MTLYTPAELAEILKISRSKVYELLGNHIPVVRVSGSLRVLKEDLDEYIQARRELKTNRPKVIRMKLKHLR